MMNQDQNTQIIIKQSEIIEILANLCRELTALLAQHTDVTEYESMINRISKEADDVTY